MTQFKLTGFRLNKLQRIAEKTSQKWCYICSLKLKKEFEMRSTFKILFYANKGKEKDGIVPIMGRITINGTQCQFSCKHSIALAKRDVKGMIRSNDTHDWPQ
jgi:hypothetical protein